MEQMRRGFAGSAVLALKKMPDRPALLPESEFTEKFLCGTGPGGQKIVSYLPPFSPSFPLPSHKLTKIEQNLQRRPTQAPGHGPRAQSPSDPLAKPEPQDRARDAGAED